jgi:hypothetical protein
VLIGVVTGSYLVGFAAFIIGAGRLAEGVTGIGQIQEEIVILRTVSAVEINTVASCEYQFTFAIKTIVTHFSTLHLANGLIGSAGIIGGEALTLVIPSLVDTFLWPAWNHLHFLLWNALAVFHYEIAQHVSSETLGAVTLGFIRCVTTDGLRVRYVPWLTVAWLQFGTNEERNILADTEAGPSASLIHDWCASARLIYFLFSGLADTIIRFLDCECRVSNAVFRTSGRAK